MNRKEIIDRDISLDILRLIGLMGIVLAHVSPPNFIMQIRTFDVPLMVIVSGIAFSISYKRGYSLMNYYKHRLERLLTPTWFFLSFYFLYFGMADFITKGQYVSVDYITNTFFLFNDGGIGYVWIIRVFILVAIGAPMVYYCNNRIRNTFVYFFLIVILFIIYFQIVDFLISNSLNEKDGIINIFISEYILYLIPYSLLFSIGLRAPKLSIKDLILCLVFLLVSFLSICIINGDNVFLTINDFKYPPQLLWTIYGTMVSIFLYIFVSRINSISYFQKPIRFLSESSLWIYLWHIFLLKNWDYGISHIPGWAKHFFVKFFIILTLASIITYLQKKTIQVILEKYNFHNFLKRIISIGFLK
jgi:Acyltransferase family